MTPRVLGVLVLALVGCDKTISDEDCRKVGANMREVWLGEAKRAAPQNGSAGDKASAVIAAEADKLVADWANECKKELLGRKADPKEMDCLMKAKTIADVSKCSTP